MAMKKSKKPMRGVSDFDREMETRKPGKRYPAFNVQPQRPQRPGNKPVEMPKKRKKAAAPKRAAVKRSYR